MWPHHNHIAEDEEEIENDKANEVFVEIDNHLFLNGGKRWLNSLRYSG